MGGHTSIHLHRYSLALCPPFLPGLVQEHSCCSPLSPSCSHICFLYRCMSCSLLPSSLCSCFSLKLPRALGHRAFALAIFSVQDAPPVPLHLGIAYLSFRCQFTVYPQEASLGALTRSGSYSRFSQAPCLFFPAYLRGCDYVCVGVRIWLEIFSPTGLSSMRTDICFCPPWRAWCLSWCRTHSEYSISMMGWEVHIPSTFARGQKPLFCRLIWDFPP